MIMTVTELRSYITTEETDAMLQMKLDAVEKIGSSRIFVGLKSK